MEVIHEIYGKDAFVKFKSTAFPIGKVLCSFVLMDAKKEAVGHIDCYLDVEEAAVFAADILSGEIRTLAVKEREKGEKYPQEIWKSPLGGVSEEDAARRGLRQDGRAISRSFGLAPGSKQAYVFTAMQRAGKNGKGGLIVPLEGAKPEMVVRVPVMNDKELKKLALNLLMAIQADKMIQMMEPGKKGVEYGITGNRTERKEGKEEPAEKVMAMPEENRLSKFMLECRSKLMPDKDGYRMQAVTKQGEAVWVVFFKGKFAMDEKWHTFEQLADKNSDRKPLRFAFRGYELTVRDHKKQIVFSSWT